MARKKGEDRGLFEKVAGSGIWWIRFTDQYGVDHKRKIGPKMLAREVVQDKRAEVVRGTFLPDRFAKQRKRLSEVIDSYLEESRSIKASWKDDRRYATVWKEAFGNRPVEEVRTADIERWRREKHAKPATINRHVSFLRRVLNVAIRDGLCKTNPASKPFLKMLRENNARIRFLTPEEEAILRSVFPPQWWHHVELAILTGLRRSEQLGLRWENIDFRNKVLMIPKSKHGEKRHVPLNPRAMEILMGIASRGKSPWVYPGQKGEHQHYSTLRKVAWEKAVKASGLQDLHWHDLRHTFCSRLVMAGVPLNTVRELAGHKSILTTQRYAHLEQSHLAAAVELLVTAPPVPQAGNAVSDPSPQLKSERKRNQTQSASKRISRKPYEDLPGSGWGPVALTVFKTAVTLTR